MRLPKRYLRRVVKKRLIEFILTFSVISIFLFGVVGARSGTGLLYQLDDNWYIDSNYRNNLKYFYEYLGISNPDLFPHVLIPENNGAEVHYICNTVEPGLAYAGPYSHTVITLDLVPVYIIKQSVLYICIIAIFSIALPYFYLNRKRFQFTNKLLG